MTKDLSSLIRLRSWQTDAKRREHARVERHLTNLRQQSVELENELTKEQKTAREAPQEGGMTYYSYAHRILEQREALKHATKAAEVQLKVVLDELAEAFRLLKTSEIVQKNRDHRQAAALERADQEFCDEVALECFRRNKT